MTPRLRGREDTRRRWSKVRRRRYALVTQRLPSGGPMSDVAAPLSASEQRTMLDAGRVWWLFLITGTAWLLFSVIVFRFDYTTVSAIAILFGILMLGFSLMEFVTVMTTSGWSRLLHAVLALRFPAQRARRRLESPAA